MEQKIIINRLAFIKYLIQKGNNETMSSEPLNSVAILNYHDALELLFDLICEDKGIQNNNLSFMQSFDKINDWLKGNNIPEIGVKQSLEKLKDRRVNLKHKGLFPSKTDIEESKYTCNLIFDEMCNSIFYLNSKDISLVDLIENANSKKAIKEAIILYNTNKKQAIEKLAISFEYLLKDYESSKISFPHGSPFYFGRNLNFLSSFNMKLKSGDIMCEFVDKTKESIEAMQKVIKILAYGLDYKKYIRFKLFIPDCIYSLGSGSPMVIGADEDITKDNFQFCIDYIIECGLKLQEFDFEIK